MQIYIENITCYTSGNCCASPCHKVYGVPLIDNVQVNFDNTGRTVLTAGTDYASCPTVQFGRVVKGTLKTCIHHFLSKIYISQSQLAHTLLSIGENSFILNAAPVLRKKQTKQVHNCKKSGLNDCNCI